MEINITSNDPLAFTAASPFILLNDDNELIDRIRQITYFDGKVIVNLNIDGSKES